jgi:uncharacterized membrane protein YphA (DoxX/SURF4 family)
LGLLQLGILNVTSGQGLLRRRLDLTVELGGSLALLVGLLDFPFAFVLLLIVLLIVIISVLFGLYREDVVVRFE